MMEEREINIKKVVWQALEQWRGILVVAISCAILLPLGMGLKNVVNTDASVVELPSKDESMKYQSIKDVVSLYMQYHALTSAYESSLLNQADYNSCRVVTSTYELTLGDPGESLVLLASAYNGVVNNEKFTASLAEVFGKKSRKESIYDVCFFSTSTSTTVTSNASNSTILNVISPDKNDKTLLVVRAFLPNGVTVEKWSEVLNESLQKYSHELTSSFGPQNIRLVNVNSSEESPEKIVEIQGKKISMINSIHQAFENKYKKLTGTDKRLVDDIIKACEDNEITVNNFADLQYELYDKWMAAHSLKQNEGIYFGFTRKWVSMGFLLGILFYLFGLVIVAGLGRKVSDNVDISSALGIRNFGSIYEYPYTGIENFFHDKLIYKYHHKSTGVDKIAEDLSTKMLFDGEEKVYIFSMGQGSQRVDEISRRQEEILNNNKIDCEFIKMNECVAAMHDADFVDKKKIFLQIIKGKTTYNMLKEFMEKVKEYKLEIVGMEFIDVPRA